MAPMPGGNGLGLAEVETLLRRDLGSEPGVQPHRLPGGLGFVCRGPFGKEAGPPRLFVVAMDGGVLLRLPREARSRVLASEAVGETSALPDWIASATFDVGPVRHSPRDFVGSPTEWVWMPIADGAAFERRRPHVREALDFCRHSLAPTRASD